MSGRNAVANLSFQASIAGFGLLVATMVGGALVLGNGSQLEPDAEVPAWVEICGGIGGSMFVLGAAALWLFALIDALRLAKKGSLVKLFLVLLGNVFAGYWYYLLDRKHAGDDSPR